VSNAANAIIENKGALVNLSNGAEHPPPDPGNESAAGVGLPSGDSKAKQAGKANLASGRYSPPCATASDAIVIARIRKNPTETVVVALDQFRGVDLVDVRIFAAYGEDGDPRATKKGVALKVEHLPALTKALADATAEARRRGLLPAEQSAAAQEPQRTGPLTNAERQRRFRNARNGKTVTRVTDRNAPVTPNDEQERFATD
jgi:hypothetical protein